LGALPARPRGFETTEVEVRAATKVGDRAPPDPRNRLAGVSRLPPAVLSLTTPVLLLFTLLVLVGPVLGVVAFRLAADRQAERRDAHLTDRLKERAYALRSHAQSLVEALHTSRSYFDWSDDVRPDEFESFARDLRSRHPAIQSLSWIPRVSAPGGDAVYRVGFVHPQAGGDVLAGLDPASHPIAGPALERAAATGQVVLTPPVDIEGSVPCQRCVLGFLAVREKDGDAPRGFVAFAVRIPDVLADATADVAGDASLRVRLLDPDAPAGTGLLHEPEDWAEAEESDTFVQRLDVAGRTWQLEGRATPAFLDEQRSYQPVVLGIAALLVWEVFCGFLILLGKGARDRQSRRQARFIRSVLQSLSEGVVVADGEGRIQLANEAAERMVGAHGRGTSAARWSSTQGCYLPDAETPYPPEQLPLARAIQGARVVDEDMYLRKPLADSGVWLSVSASPIRDETEGVTGGVVVFRDITQRKKTEAAIMRLSNAVEQTADAVIITDRRGRIEYVNPAFESATGYASEEVLGRTPRLFGPDSYSEDEYRELWKTLLRGKVYRVSAASRRKSGELYDVEQTITPMRDANGRITHFVSVARDVTEKKRRREQEFEMRLAARVQRHLFPESPPKVPGFDIAGAVFPAAETSGDYFDYIPLPDGTLTLAIGDVSGHGFGPALLMAETRAYLRSLLAADANLGSVLDRLNHSLQVDFKSEHFVTLLLAHVDPVRRTLVHANAGHVPGYVLDARGEIKHELLGTGPILGIFENRTYAGGEPVALETGDVVVLLTDGVTETRGSRDTFFGYSHALEIVREHRDLGAEEIVRALHRAVRAFAREESARDDTTILVCKVT